jgi:MarR family transcriptional regulator, lower aerobic nicotinate degradation pathway regulator
MDRYELLTQVIDKVGEYATTATNEQPISVENFAAWLTTSLIGEKNNPKSASLSGDVMDVTINRYIGLMYRYTRFYGKKALENLPLQYDEFSYLVSLYSNGGMTKTELIGMNVQEKTTGMEIIKRLVGYGFIFQTDDPHDRRSQRLEISPLGTEILRGAFGGMAKVSSIVTGNLTLAEKRILMNTLQKMEVFHKLVGENERHLDLDTILEKYFN